MLSESLEVDFVLQTVEQLIEKHGISLNKETMIHSDQGSHYTGIKFINLLKAGNCDSPCPGKDAAGITYPRGVPLGI